jgi:hypothetical protein
LFATTPPEAIKPAVEEAVALAKIINKSGMVGNVIV